MNIQEKIFKAYDIRGVYPAELDEATAYCVGKAFGTVIAKKGDKVCVGRDVRNSGESLSKALIKGLQDAELDVTWIGVITTDMLYFASATGGFDGGIVVSASHNPPEYNGFKMVRKNAEAVSGDTGIQDIRKEVERLAEGEIPQAFEPGPVKEIDVREGFVDYAAGLVDIKALQNARPLRIAVNPNHGAAGKNIVMLLEKYKLPITLEKYFFDEDGSYPQGRPDPLYADNQKGFSDFMRGKGCDFGVAWDGDADRCFFFDESGAFIDSYYTTAFFAGLFLQKKEGETIVYDPRQTWAILDALEARKGKGVMNRVGHSFIKAAMKRENAAFCGETSGHFYFRDFWFADSGLVPFLYMLEEYTKAGKRMSELFGELRRKYPISGEVNVTIAEPQAAIARVAEAYKDMRQPDVDGLSLEKKGEWRCNIRSSNTEPLLRVNLEAVSQEAVDQKLREVMGLVKG